MPNKLAQMPPGGLQVPPGNPRSGQFPGIPAPIDWSRDGKNSPLNNPADQPGGQFPTKPAPGIPGPGPEIESPKPTGR